VRPEGLRKFKKIIHFVGCRTRATFRLVAQCPNNCAASVRMPYASSLATIHLLDSVGRVANRGTNERRTGNDLEGSGSHATSVVAMLTRSVIVSGLIN
jgi:hypothetical protein